MPAHKDSYIHADIPNRRDLGWDQLRLHINIHINHGGGYRCRPDPENCQTSLSSQACWLRAGRTPS